MCTASYQAQLIRAKKVLASEAVMVMTQKEVKFSFFDNHQFTTLPMLYIKSVIKITKSKL